MKNYLKILSIILLFSSCDDGIVNLSDNISGVKVLEVIMTPENLAKLRSNRTNDAEVPINYFFEGGKFSGTIEASGAGSRYFPRWSYVIEKKDDGLENEFNLSAQVHDPTMIHTAIAIEYYKKLGLLTFDSDHIFLKINNEDESLLSQIERVDENYFNKRNIETYELYKVGFGSKFTFKEGIFYPEFHFEKKIPDDDETYTSLEEFINAVDTSNSKNLLMTLGKFLNIENYIKYHAATTILNNDDSFTNNFFLFKENSKSPFTIIPWDFDKCFSTLSDVKFGGENAIIKKIFMNEITFNMYKDEIKNQINNIYNEEFLFPIIDYNANKIKEAYNIDPYLGKDGRFNFDQEIEKLKTYIKVRRKFFEDNINDLSQNYFK